MTFNILTDSTADLDEKWAQENKVELVGLTITLMILPMRPLALTV